MESGLALFTKESEPKYESDNIKKIQEFVSGLAY